MSQDMTALLIKSLGETIYMVTVSMLIATAIGIPIGVLLVTTAKKQILEFVGFNRVLAGIVNAVRSVPFIILMVAIIPVTRLIVGSSIG
ncbi:MAG: methionine ABC transporter permease, partial [Selenomonadaceae bacterium]